MWLSITSTCWMDIGHLEISTANCVVSSQLYQCVHRFSHLWQFQLTGNFTSCPHNSFQNCFPKYISPRNRSSWSRGSVPSSRARGQLFEPRCWHYLKLMLDPGDFHSNPSGLLSFNKSETVLWTIAKILLLYICVDCRIHWIVEKP